MEKKSLLQVFEPGSKSPKSTQFTTAPKSTMQLSFAFHIFISIFFAFSFFLKEKNRYRSNLNQGLTDHKRWPYNHCLHFKLRVVQCNKLRVALNQLNGIGWVLFVLKQVSESFRQSFFFYKCIGDLLPIWGALLCPQRQLSSEHHFVFTSFCLSTASSILT